MADNITKFTKLLKERDNPELPGVLIGEVISASPIKIRLNEMVVLQARHVYLSHALSLAGLNSGDNVACIPSSDSQTFFIADKVVSG